MTRKHGALKARLRKASEKRLGQGERRLRFAGVGQGATGEVFSAAALAAELFHDFAQERAHIAGGVGVLGKNECSGFLESQESDDVRSARECGGEKLKIFGLRVFEDFGDDTGSIGSRWGGLEARSGISFSQSWLKGFEILADDFPFAQKALDRSFGVNGSAFKQGGDTGEEIGVVARGGFGAATADEFDAPVLTDSPAAAKQNHTDLPGMANVSATAGLQVDAGDFDGAKNADAFDLFADTQFGELLGGAVANSNFAIFEDNGIGGASCAFQDEVRGLLAAEVNAADGLAKMERDGGQAETFLKNGGEQMLTGVLLHVVEAARPVDAAFDAAGGDRAINDVQDVLVLEVADVENVGFAELAEIVGLTAGSWIEVGLVE